MALEKDVLQKMTAKIKKNFGKMGENAIISRILENDYGQFQDGFRQYIQMTLGGN